MRDPSPGRCSSPRPTCPGCWRGSATPRRRQATSLRAEMPEIGETLRDARMRARIDVSEIEAKTKIRAKYLRALENEEWGLLPGPTFVKSFLRTYAEALDLDAKALVEEYRRHHERPSEAMLEPIVSTPQSKRPRNRSSAGGRGGSRGHPEGRRQAGGRAGSRGSGEKPSRGY